jgi:hypothetical protein
MTRDGTVALSRNVPGSPAKWRLSFMEGRKKGSNHSTVPMTCRLWAAKWRQSHGVIAQCNSARAATGSHRGTGIGLPGPSSAYGQRR